MTDWIQLQKSLKSSCLKGLIPRETVYYSSFWNTIGHSELHMHAERENALLPRFPALANEKNGRINDWIRKASPTDVSWWISIHGLAHLGLRRPTGRQYWVCACAICGYNKSTLCFLVNKQELRKKWLNQTLPLFQHLRGSGTEAWAWWPGHGGQGTAIEYRKKSCLGAPRPPELSSRARCTAAGPRSRGPLAELPDFGGAFPRVQR